MKKILSSLAVLISLGACATKNISIETPATFTPHLSGAPGAGSAEDIQDYRTLLGLQKSRTPADCARGATEVKINLDSFYGPTYGPLSRSEVEKWNESFQSFSDLAWPLIGNAKEHWERPRPFNAHSDLIPCVKLEKSFSYPSGHSALARYFMHILMDLVPGKNQALASRADQIAFDRNLVGVHYPSDVRDGKILGDQIYDFLKDDPKFKATLEKAKAKS